VLAVATTVAYFVVAYLYPWAVRRLPSSHASSAVRIVYEDGRGILRDVVAACTRSGFAIADVEVDRPDGGVENGNLVRVLLEIHGTSPVAELAAKVGDVPGVHEVHAGDVNELFD
jgi:putative Mg2+ transporter-C (MgtC) family protein